VTPSKRPVSYGAIVSDGYHIKLAVRLDTAALTYELPPDVAALGPHAADFTMAGFLKLIRIFAGSAGAADARHFEYAAPGTSESTSACFPRLRSFEQPFTGIEFPGAFLSRSPSMTSSELFAVLRIKPSACSTDAPRTRARRVASRVVRGVRAGANSDHERRGQGTRHKRALPPAPLSRRRVVSSRYSRTPSRTLHAHARRVPAFRAGNGLAVGFSDPRRFHRAFQAVEGSDAEAIPGRIVARGPRRQHGEPSSLTEQRAGDETMGGAFGTALTPPLLDLRRRYSEPPYARRNSPRSPGITCLDEATLHQQIRSWLDADSVDD